MDAWHASHPAPRTLAAPRKRRRPRHRSLLPPGIMLYHDVGRRISTTPTSSARRAPPLSAASAATFLKAERRRRGTAGPCDSTSDVGIHPAIMLTEHMQEETVPSALGLAQPACRRGATSVSASSTCPSHSTVFDALWRDRRRNHRRRPRAHAPARPGRASRRAGGDLPRPRTRHDHVLPALYHEQWPVPRAPCETSEMCRRGDPPRWRSRVHPSLLSAVVIARARLLWRPRRARPAAPAPRAGTRVRCIDAREVTFNRCAPRHSSLALESPRPGAARADRRRRRAAARTRPSTHRRAPRARRRRAARRRGPAPRLQGGVDTSTGTSCCMDVCGVVFISLARGRGGSHVPPRAHTGRA